VITFLKMTVHVHLVIGIVATLLGLTMVDPTLFIGRYFINWLAPPSSDSMSWDSYHRLDTIYTWMNSLAQRYPQKLRIQTIGQSVEGRDIKVARIGTRNPRRRQLGPKRAIFIEGGIHAREWISPATVTYIMRDLVTNPRHNAMLDQYDFFILPVVNPDGYEYTHTSDRLWRKNRANNPLTLGLCRGVDLNRNFGFKWAEGVFILDPRPASPIPCLDTYHGPEAFSEPETQAVRNFVMGKRDRIDAYLGFHSFGNKILYPWGHTDEKVKDWRDLKAFADVAQKAIAEEASSRRSYDSLSDEDLVKDYKVEQQSKRSNPDSHYENSFEPIGNSLRRIFTNTELDDPFSQTDQGYDVGTATETLYRVAGASDDWARGEAGIKWVLLFELPGGVYGFLLPPRYITSVGSSIMAGVEAMVGHIASR